MRWTTTKRTVFQAQCLCQPSVPRLRGSGTPTACLVHNQLVVPGINLGGTESICRRRVRSSTLAALPHAAKHNQFVLHPSLTEERSPACAPPSITLRWVLREPQDKVCACPTLGPPGS